MYRGDMYVGAKSTVSFEEAFDEETLQKIIRYLKGDYSRKRKSLLAPDTLGYWFLQAQSLYGRHNNSLGTVDIQGVCSC